MSTLTIKDIARICNVGISTVSRAINDDPGINKNTKERILKVIEEYHYVPNNSARNLKMTESNTIALLIKGIDNQFFQGMLKIFEEELKKLEYTFLIHAVGEDQDDASVAVELAKEKRLKGIIFLGGLMDYPEEKMRLIGIPYVLCTVAVNMDAPKRNCLSVSIDDEKESYKAVDYLCKKGHKRIAIISGRETDYAVGRLRLEGYRKALKDNGIEFDPGLVRFMKSDIPEYSSANGYQVTKELIESGEDFTAIYAISDLIAFGVYKAIFDAGKRIPEDYSVMGFDGIEMTKYYNPSLTTMVQPCDQMVKNSIELLMKAIDGDTEKQQLIFDADLLERDSVAEIHPSV
ncbi:MAG: LacI family DNA-binding transcriptional regulator [Eubacterium sp.]